MDLGSGLDLVVDLDQWLPQPRIDYDVPVMDPRDSTCWSLVRGAAAGDPEKRESFARLYAPVIRAYLGARWRLPADHEQVEEATQEVFLQFFKPKGALQAVEAGRPGGFRAFLYGVTRNVAGTVASGRARRRREQGSDGLPSVESDEASLSRVFDKEFARALTREARWVLASRAGDSGSPSSLRLKALELMYEKGMPSRDIARELGLDAAAVYPLMTRARREFRATLFEVLASYHPEETRPQIEQRCLDVFSAL